MKVIRKRGVLGKREGMTDDWSKEEQKREGVQFDQSWEGEGGMSV